MSKANSVLRKTPVLNCIFCGSPDPTSEEHIFPAWFYRALDNASLIYTETTNFKHRQLTGEIDSEHIVTSDDATCPVLCTLCNERFSGDIQSKAAPILIPFITGGWNKLSREEIRIIVRWYTCHLMVREMQHDYHETITQQERFDFKDRGFIPQSLNIWMGPIEELNINSCHRPIFDLPANEKFNFASSTLGHLAFVSYSADQDSYLGQSSVEFKNIKELMSEMNFVQIRDYDRRMLIDFPENKPEFNNFPGVLGVVHIFYLMVQHNFPASFQLAVDNIPSDE